MIVGQLDPIGVAVSPHKADAPLIVDADAVLAGPVAPQCLQVVSGRHPQVRNGGCGVEHSQFEASAEMNVSRKLGRSFAVPDLFGLLAGKAYDHERPSSRL